MFLASTSFFLLNLVCALQVELPEDKSVKHAVDTLAAYVAKHGRRFEDLARDRQVFQQFLELQFILYII